MIDQSQIQQFAERAAEIKREIAKEIIGQEAVVDQLLTVMIAGGNALLEGVPGLGKTRLVRTLSQVFDMPFSRIQFTPDLMPADITGTNIIVKTENGNEFRFREGPLFASIVLADEINRATPKTQAALLEAMQEHSVTVAGETHVLAEPYFVLATQNPMEQEGTYPLPEAQLDRFGASPRAAQAIIAVARVRALMAGRYNVAYEDIEALAPACLRHRIALSFEGMAEGETAEGVIAGLLKTLPRE